MWWDCDLDDRVLDGVVFEVVALLVAVRLVVPKPANVKNMV